MKKYNKEIFKQKAITIHKNKYDYSKVNYINSLTKVIIICKKHGEFKQTPNNHWRGQDCSKCSHSSYSKAQISWLNKIANAKNIYIQHAENEGEKKIIINKNKSFYVDGYSLQNNTIYEFHGDFWHGNPKIFNPNKINSVNKIKYGQLMKNTLHKEMLLTKFLKNKYNYECIWEYQYNKIIK